MPKYIVPVVEGIGERTAVPELLRRILYERMGLYDHVVGRAVSAKGEGNLTRRIENFVRYALQSAPDAIIVIRDSDEECAQDLAKGLADKCLALNTQTPIAIVCAVREYENWFLASLESLVEGAARFPGDPDAITGAKRRLQDFLPGNSYRPTRDQTGLTHQIDLEVALLNSRSFRRLCHAVEELVNAIDSGTVSVTPSLG